MAAVENISRIGMKTRLLARQPAKLLPIVRLRLMSEEKPGSVKANSGKTPEELVKDDPKSYHVPEYYSYNKDTFADLEVEMSEAGYRQSQPDPRIPYYHHYPWENKSA